MKIYVGEQGNCIYDLTGIEQSVLDTMVAVYELPTLPTKQDYSIIIKADKSQEKVWAEYVKNAKTEAEIAQEAVDAYTLDLMEKGLL